MTEREERERETDRQTERDRERQRERERDTHEYTYPHRTHPCLERSRNNSTWLSCYSDDELKFSQNMKTEPGHDNFYNFTCASSKV